MLTRQLVFGTTFAVFAAAMLAVGFTNCSPSFSINKLGKVSASSNCGVGNKGVSTDFSSLDLARTCGDIANYQCDAREFRPGIGNSSAIEPTCLATPLGQKCLPVAVTKYDTAGTRSLTDLPTAAFAEGGSFNHGEVSCFNRQILRDGVAVFSAERATLEEALRAAIEKCESGGP